MGAPRGRLLAGRYAILSEIGSGGMGTVYRARDTGTGRLVAIKLLHPHLARDPAYLERFRREAKIALALDSRHIVQVLDFGHEGESHFLVMEHVEGTSLRCLLQSRRRLALQDALRVAIQVARALEEAHSKGVVHRDIKPENILVLGDGSAKVADFGIARAEDYSTLTVTGAFIGTVQYMAPEVFTGSADFRSDIYSLGIVLYQMLAGAPPFDAPTPWEVMRQHREEVPPPLERRVPGLSETVEGLVRRCLAKEPDERFPSAFEVRRELEASVPSVGEPVGQVAAALSVAVRPAPWVRLARAPFRTSAGAVRFMRIAAEAAWRRLRRAALYGVRAAVVATSSVPRAATGAIGSVRHRRWHVQRSAVAIAAVTVLLLAGTLAAYLVVLRGNGHELQEVSGGVQVQPISVPNVTPEVMGPVLSLNDVRALVPEGWALDDWMASEDQHYIVLATTGPQRTLAGAARVLSVYRRDTNGFSEVAHWADEPGMPGRTEVVERKDVLRPDESGTRRLPIGTFSGEGKLGSSALLTIDAGGLVTISGEVVPARQSGTPVAESTQVVDPRAVVSVKPNPEYGVTPQPSLTVPAGAVPAGWTVSQAVWSDDRQHLAIVTVDAPYGFSGMSQLSIYDVGGGQFAELWREVNEFVTIDENLAFKDVNGDGLPDLVYSTSNGGNGWTWSPTLALTLNKDGTAEDLTFRLPIEASSPEGPVDLDGDGVYEWTATDASWEETNCFSHAGSPSSMFVLAWNGRDYVDATYRYPEAVDQSRLEMNRTLGSDHLDPQPPPAEASDGAALDKDKFLSESVGRYLDYWNSGRKTEAGGILAALQAYESFGEIGAKRDWIVATLERDPHDPRGSEIRLGKCPLPYVH